MEFTLLWAALTGVGLVWLGTRLWSEGLPDRPTDRLIGAAAAGLLIGRLVAMLAQGTNPLLHPADILLVRGGVNTPAAASAALIVYLWSVKGHIKFMDASAPAAVLGLAGWHAGCIWTGACLGAASDAPWTWSLPDSSVNRHPVEIYAAVGLILAAWLVSKLPFTTLARTGIGLALASTVRLLTEPLRMTIESHMAAWYLAGVIVGFGLAVMGRAGLITGNAHAT